MLEFEKYKAKYIANKKENHSLEQCLINISEYFDIPVTKIISKSRKQPIVNARMYYFFTARYLLRSMNNESLSYLGGTLNKDHSTVVNAIKNFKNYYETDEEFRDNYNTFICGVYGLSAFNELKNLHNR